MQAKWGSSLGPLRKRIYRALFTVRERDLEAITNKLRGQAGARLLDLGCGAGHVSFAAAAHVGSVVAYDLSAAMIDVVAQEAKRRNLHNVVTKEGRVETLPFEDARFDWVCTRYSAHHWTDILAALREARRVLKRGGGLIVIDTVAPTDPLFDTHLQTIELLRGRIPCAELHAG